MLAQKSWDKFALVAFLHVTVSHVRIQLALPPPHLQCWSRAHARYILLLRFLLRAQRQLKTYLCICFSTGRTWDRLADWSQVDWTSEK